LPLAARLRSFRVQRRGVERGTGAPARRRHQREPSDSSSQQTAADSCRTDADADARAAAIYAIGSHPPSTCGITPSHHPHSITGVCSEFVQRSVICPASVSADGGIRYHHRMLARRRQAKHATTKNTRPRPRTNGLAIACTARRPPPVTTRGVATYCATASSLTLASVLTPPKLHARSAHSLQAPPLSWRSVAPWHDVRVPKGRCSGDGAGVGARGRGGCTASRLRVRVAVTLIAAAV